MSLKFCSSSGHIGHQNYAGRLADISEHYFICIYSTGYLFMYDDYIYMVQYLFNNLHWNIIFNEFHTILGRKDCRWRIVAGRVQPLPH